MKKILIFLFLIVSVASSGQSGNGSSGNPFYGTISTNVQWSMGDPNFGSTVYIGTSTNPDLTINSGGYLTIDPGITVIFTQTTSDLRITGSGQIAAGGNGSPVVFTKSITKSNWGHISFESMTTLNPQNYPSIITNSRIEFGDVSSTSLTPANPNQYGGAIHADWSFLTISNCEISNNKAGWGAGIFINIGRNPSITNCYIHNNIASISGGGLYLYTDTYSNVTNCIITYNSCIGAGGGGGIFLGNQALNVKIVNSLISHNSAANQTLGHNIRFFNNTRSTKPQFINSIIWYPASSIIGSSYDADFYYCAIQDPPRATYTGCVSLNSLNEGTNPLGPYFESMTGSNWALQFRSPCRDIGTTPNPAVTLDYVGNSRISNYDIGPYEFQYSRWKTTAASTDWTSAGNWDGGVPSSSRDVIIPTSASNYPTDDASPPSFTIGTGKQMIIEQGARVTLNSLTNNGTLRMLETAAGVSSLIMDSYDNSGGGTEDIQLYLTGGYIGDPEDQVGRWHYISTPISDFPVGTFTANTLDLATWVDGLQGAASIVLGFVAYDGFQYLVDDPLALPSSWAGYDYRFSTLDLGKGYNFWDNLTSNTYSLSGNLNTSDVSVTLDFAGADYENGFNLLGNPFTSGLDWDYILTNTTFPANTSQSIYFTKDGVQYSYVSGVAVPDDGIAAPSGVIPPMQGFFVKTYEDAVQINLSAGARTHGDIAPRYKGSEIIPLVRLAITDNGTSDETVVRFAETAKTGVDYVYDAMKMAVPANKSGIYTSDISTKYSINGQPYPQIGTFTEIPVIVKVTADGNHTISVKQLQGLEAYGITLTDIQTGFTADLSTTSELQFAASTGLITDRFVLKISNIITGIEEPVNKTGTFNVYSGFGSINIQTISDEWDGKTGSVKVFDLAGKTMNDLQNTEFNRNSLTQVEAPEAKGLYVVEIRSGVRRWVGKVVIR